MVVRGMLAKNSVIKIIELDMIWATVAVGHAIKFPMSGINPSTPVASQKYIIIGTKGRTKKLTKKEINETKPDILMMIGKRKIWTANVE